MPFTSMIGQKGNGLGWKLKMNLERNIDFANKKQH